MRHVFVFIVGVMLSVFTLTPAMADDQDIDKQIARYFGKDFLSRPLDNSPTSDVASYSPLKASRFSYELRNKRGGNRGSEMETLRRLSKPVQGAKWVRQVSDDLANYLTVDADGHIVRTAHANRPENVLSTFAPPEAIFPQGLTVGQTHERKIKVVVYKPLNTTNVAYRGTLTQTITYKGAYRVKTPAGTFDTILLSYQVKGSVGPASIDNLVCAFFAKGVGKVASIEHRCVSAMLIYNDDSTVGKILKRYQFAK